MCHSVNCIPRKYISPREIKFIPELTPPVDPVFNYLLEEAVAGRVPVYFAAIPLALVVPFSEDYHPEDHPVGKQMIDDIFEEWGRGDLKFMWVYLRGEQFVVSDDYGTLAAAKLGQPDYLPCWILGNPHLPGVKEIQGPMIPDQVKKMLFG